MTLEEKNELLEIFIAEKDRIFKEETPVVSEINSLRDKLLILSHEDRIHYLDFVKDLKNLIFEQGITVNGLELELFTVNSNVRKEVIAEETPAVTHVATTNYKEFFLAIVKCLNYELKTLKGYFFIHLQTDPNLKYLPLILHDGKCFYQPSQKSLAATFEDVVCLPIDEFKTNLEKGKYQSINFVGLCLLSTKINDETSINSNKQDLSSIIDSFTEFNQLTLKKLNNPAHSDVFYNNDKTAFLDEIVYVTSIILTNAELSNDEEKLIKKLFSSASNTLEYKVLKGGKSGSKVLEVRPRMKFSGHLAKRFVVKFGELNDKNKIFLESKSFSENIEYYATQNYEQAKYEKNSTVEGMKYTYASKDSVINSFSFANILSEKENIYYPERKKIIEDLFSYEPFELWNDSKEQGTWKVCELYKKYIKPEKVFNWIKLIKGISETELNTEQIYLDFQVIFNYDLNTKIKICHGDLHSENFFKDDNGIYLIDFGFTELNHAHVDHTALECSIKFKHIPTYIELNVLMDIEDKLLLDESFNAGFALNTQRKDILDYFDLINSIRLDSLKYSINKNSHLEYLISLFVMTCRQFQYEDLNQIYALKSAEKIGKKIIRLISV